MFAAAPLLLAPVAAYNLFFLLGGGLGGGGLAVRDGAARLTAPIFRLTTAPGGVWPVSAADFLLAGALVALYLDLLRSGASGRLAIVNHGLSAALFTLCLAEMLLAPACATSTFFLITLMVLLDVLAGFVVSFGAGRRGARPGQADEPEYR